MQYIHSLITQLSWYRQAGPDVNSQDPGAATPASPGTRPLTCEAEAEVGRRPGPVGLITRPGCTCERKAWACVSTPLLVTSFRPGVLPDRWKQIAHVESELQRCQALWCQTTRRKWAGQVRPFPTCEPRFPSPASQGTHRQSHI